MGLGQETPDRSDTTRHRVAPSVSRTRAAGPRRIVAGLVGAAFVILLWWLLSLGVPPYLLPGPRVVAGTFLRLAAEGQLGANIVETTLTAIAGLGVASVVAGMLAIAFVLFKPVESAVYPVVIALRSVPAVAAAPLLVIWTGTGPIMKTVVAAFVAFFPILVYVMHGLRGPMREYVNQFAVWGASRRQVLWYLRIPWALPSFFAALRVAVTYALIGSFVAELMGSQRGLGRMVFSAYYHFDTATVIVGIICFALLGIVLFGLAAGLEKLVLKRIPVSSQ